MLWKDVQHYDANDEACVQALRERCLDGGRVAFQFQEAGRTEFAGTHLWEIGQNFGINIFVFEQEKFPVAWKSFHDDASAMICQMRIWWIEGYLQARAEWQRNASSIRKDRVVPFPDVTIPEQLKLAGTFSQHLEYREKMLVSEEMRALLQESLNDKRLLEEGENPQILADWSFCRIDPEAKPKRVTHDSSVFFFRDGSDYLGEKDENEYSYMGVLFGRRDHDFTAEGRILTWRMHIPDDQHQTILLPVADYAQEYTKGNVTKLDVIHKYLLLILNEQSAWCEIEGASELEEAKGSVAVV